MSSNKRARVSHGKDSGGGSGGGGEAGEVGRLVDSSQADDRRMIRLVRARRLLYARNNMPVASYYLQVKKLWQQVANEMGWTVADVRRKWSHIRNSYSRHLRNEMYGVRTGRGRMVSKWYLADELDFLREHMATDTRPSRFSYAPLFLDMKAVASESQPAVEPVDLKPFIASSWFALGSPPSAPPAPSAPTASLAPAAPLLVNADAGQHEDSSSAHSFDAEENSSYFQFFRVIHSDYLELPATKQRLFRRECLAFLHHLLDAEEPQRDALNLSQAPNTDTDDDDGQVNTDPEVLIKAEPEDTCDILPH